MKSIAPRAAAVRLTLIFACAIVTHNSHAATQQSASSAAARPKFSAAEEAFEKQASAIPSEKPAVAAAPQSGTPLQTELIGKELTPSNALFPRKIWGKDKNGEEIELSTVARTLLIFLDEDEYRAKMISTATQATLDAIHQQAAPMLVSTSLLCNIFGVQKQTDPHAPKAQFLRLVAKNFDPRKWKIFTVEPSAALFLLIPNHYADNVPQGASGAEAVSREQHIGLHGIPWTYSGDARKAWHAQFASMSKPGDSIAAIARIIDAPQLLFVPQQDYRTHRLPIPQWVIHMAGHGVTSEVVAGLSLKTFSTLLTALKTKIVTKLFVYTSCFSAGKTQDEVYGTLRNNIGDALYPFPIMTFGITQTPVRAWTGRPIGKKMTSLSDFASETDYAYFSMLGENTAPTPLLNIAAMLRPIIHPTVQHNQTVTAAEAYKYLAEAIPLVRPPNRDRFFPLIELVRIDATMAETRTEKLNASAFSKQHTAHALKTPIAKLPKELDDAPLFIALDTPYIPFELVINRDPVYLYPQILSISSASQHYLAHVSTNYAFSPHPWEESFWSIFPQLAYRSPYLGGIDLGAIFFIKRLVFTAPRIRELSNVVIHINAQDRNTLIFFTENGKQYAMQPKTHAITDSPEDYMGPGSLYPILALGLPRGGVLARQEWTKQLAQHFARKIEAQKDRSESSPEQEAKVSAQAPTPTPVTTSGSTSLPKTLPQASVLRRRTRPVERIID